MIDYDNFEIWLKENKCYSDKTVSNIISRLKRSNNFCELNDDDIYLFLLNNNKEFIKLSPSVKSQIKKSVKLYYEFQKFNNINTKKISNKHNILSLFSNIGVAEAYLEKSGFNVVVANEIDKRRALLYSKIYTHTNMICGDITKKEIFDKVIDSSVKNNVDIIMATPPCQGMSTAGQQKENDVRNKLICYVIDAVIAIKPSYVFIENVPMFLKTSIIVNRQKINIIDLIKKKLSKEYKINIDIIDTKFYSVPQTRERAIILLSKKGLKEWKIPEKDKKIVTLRDAIGDIPDIDPFVSDISEKEMNKLFPDYFEKKERALKISSWNIPPAHIKRQVVSMMYTPTGKTALDNTKHFPIKEDGSKVKGYHNTYKRQNWDMPAYTVTMDNRKISSQNNVHPGRKIKNNKNGETIYSDPRSLTLYEIMRVMSIPDDWPVPKDTSEAFLRRVIGEGIPSLFVKKVFLNLEE